MNTKQNPIKRIKTFEDACIDQGKNPNELKFQYQEGEDIDNSSTAFERLKVIRNALLNNSKEKPIYYPYFNHNKKPGSGFFDSDYDDWLVHSSLVSSRLKLDTPEKTMYFGSQFEEDWYKYLVEH